MNAFPAAIKALFGGWSIVDLLHCSNSLNRAQHASVYVYNTTAWQFVSILHFGESVAGVCQRVNEIFQYSPAALWHKQSACEGERGLLWWHMTLPIVHLLHMSVKMQLYNLYQNYQPHDTGNLMTTKVINKQQWALCMPLLRIQLNAGKEISLHANVSITQPQYSWTQHSGAELIYCYYFGMDKKKEKKKPNLFHCLAL